MSISVKHLNADTTFLITFSDAAALEHQARAAHPTCPFTVLVDPWLAGSSSIWNPRFQVSRHVEEPIVYSLADLPLPNAILISQGKPDHCHEETLRTLPSDSPVTILAVPDAAKKIRSWKHFSHAAIVCLPVWDLKSPDTVFRIQLQSRDHHHLFDSPGEITISYIPQRYDVTNVHNAIGITYLPPALMPLDMAAMPLSPPLTPAASRATSPTADDSHMDAGPQISLGSGEKSYAKSRGRRGRPLSVLYSPHGIGIPCITPFMTQYLAPLNALPLTALFHSINVEQNPWFLGGRVCNGFSGGSAIIRRFGARYWLSAHDEIKDNRGWSIAMLKSRFYTVEEAQELLDNDKDQDAATLEQGHIMTYTSILRLENGEEFKFGL